MPAWVALGLLGWENGGAMGMPKWGGYVGAFVLGAAAGVVAMAGPGQADDRLFGTPLRDQDTGYAYVAPLLACNVGAEEESVSLSGLKSSFSSLIDAAVASGAIEHTSVYFRVLDTGEWTAVDGDAPHSPASLMKVPILMAYLEAAQRTPAILRERVAYVPATDEAQVIFPTQTLAAGEMYTVEDLLKAMVMYSDNGARDVLMEYIDYGILSETLEDLGIPLPKQGTEYTVSPRLYSRLFRILYNGTYLTPEMSELGLSWLAQSEYADGIRAGVPDDVEVANKFGNATVTGADGTDTYELHDCGIVYAELPYTLCVMTRGDDLAALADVIAELSRVAFASP